MLHLMFSFRTSLHLIIEGEASRHHWNFTYTSMDYWNFIFIKYKCGHRNVLSKRQVWMSIFHIINFKKKKSWTQGPGFFLIKN